MNWKQMKGIITHRFGELPNKENIALVRSCAAEGIVLLKNEKVLPLREKKVALFGAGAVETIICGTGSGYVFPAYTVTVKDGLEHAGMQITSAAWLKRFAQMSKQANKKDKTLSFLDRMWSGKTILTEEPEISGEELEQAREAKTAIYVIRRNAGEEADRRAEKGDYYLSDRERSNLERIAASFAHTVVVLNTCMMDAGFTEKIAGIDAVVFLGMVGMEARNALADVLTGNVNPSGRLADTWAKRYQDYPAAEVFSSNDGITLQEDYIEDIYVGYRWFDTMGITPFYPFGYGLSYTEFQYKIRSATGNWQKITVEVEVKNTGAFAGKEVVQLYVSAPEGRLEKPYQELKAFAKTSRLKPGETELLSLQFATEDLSSFDEAQSAFVMEPGQYAVRVGKNSRDTAVAAVIELDGEAVTRKVTKALSPDRELHLKKGNKQKADITPYTEAEYRIFLKACECRTKDETSRIPKRMITYVPEGETYIPYVEKNKYQMPYPCREEVRTVKNCPDATLLDVYEGRVSLEEFVASLEPEVLTRIVTGTLEETPYAAKKRWNRKVKLPNVAMSSGQTTGQYVESLGIPPAYLFDGPAGMHIIGCADGTLNIIRKIRF